MEENIFENQVIQSNRKSKVCIVSVVAPRNMIMLNMYTTILNDKKIQYDIIYLDRFMENEITGAANTYRIEYKRTSKASIILGYIKYKKQAETILKKNKYDFIIVWGELCAAILANVLKKYYRNKYCVNVRDLFVNRRKVLNPRLFKAIRFSLGYDADVIEYIYFNPYEMNW